MVRAQGLRITATVLLVAGMVCLPSCDGAPQLAAEAQVSEAMVQVWRPADRPGESATMMSFGVVVGDGRQVLTWLDYEDYTPGGLKVVTKSGDSFGASVEAVHPPSGITLLRLRHSGRLPAVAVADRAPPDVGQALRIWGWSGPGYSDFGGAAITVTADQAPRPLFFSVMYDGSTGVDFPGAVVTDKMNRVLGFETTFRSRLAIFLGPMGRMPPIASIGSGVVLLLPRTRYPSWADGPALSIIADHSYMSGYFGGTLPSPSYYPRMTSEAHQICQRLGEPTDTGDLSLDGPFCFESLEGTLLVLVYPRPVRLVGSTGRVIAQARWIGIQWGRHGALPNRLVCGMEPYTIQAGFVILEDVAELKRSVPSPGTPNSQ